MKLLFSRYSFLINELSQLAFDFGYKGNLSLLLCKTLKLKGKPIRPTRASISTPEMKQLTRLAEKCYSDIFFFVGLLPV